MNPNLLKFPGSEWNESVSDWDPPSESENPGGGASRDGPGAGQTAGTWVISLGGGGGTPRLTSLSPWIKEMIMRPDYVVPNNTHSDFHVPGMYFGVNIKILSSLVALR